MLILNSLVVLMSALFESHSDIFLSSDFSMLHNLVMGVGDGYTVLDDRN